MKNYRWWEIALIWIDKLPTWLIETNTRTVEKGNSWHNHNIDNWKIYIIKNTENLEENDFIFGYLEAKNTKLYHEEHWMWCIIADWFYEFTKQKEFTPNWLKIVVD
jgi:hypothetical protein